ncbi:unnamed protein product [Paramecium sonneborni]|nr:unnamed protein product [Paramecium sonneborni]
MEQYNKNSFKVKKFDGDIPIDELMNLQKKIQTEKSQVKSQQQQQIRQPQQQYVQRQQVQHQQQKCQQQQQFQPFSGFNQQQQQQQQQSKSQQDIFAQFNNPQQGFGSNNVWDNSNQWNQQQNNFSAFDNFGFVATSHSPSPNPFQWDSQFNPPQQQQQQQQQQVHQMQINSFQASPANSAWDMTTNFTEQSHQSTQPSTNFWIGNSQQQFGIQTTQIQSQQLPLNPQQETIDLIGLNDPQPQQQQYDLSNIIL